MWTKRDLIEAGYGELAIAGHGVDLSPEEMQTSVRVLDAMMAAWDARGIRIGYSMGGELADSSSIPDSAAEAVYQNFAVRRAAAYGKQLSAETRAQARQGLNALLTAAAFPQQQQQPNTMPAGQGNRRQRWFMPEPDLDPLTNTQGGDLLVLPE